MSKKMSRDEILRLIKYYEQSYFTNDDPIPFKDGLTIYPVLVKDYYKFYSCVGFLKMNKNDDMIGVTMSNLGYLLHCFQQEDKKDMFVQFIQMIELIFHIKNSMKCPVCGGVIEYKDISIEMEKIQKIKDESIRNHKMNQYLQSVEICDNCSTEDNIVHRQQMISYIKEKGKNCLIIDGVTIDTNEYDILKNIILYYNIPDFDDEYIDPELKAELDEVARLKNPNNVQPSLEKQMSCIVSAGVSYTYETLKQVSIRKLVLLLRTIDARLHYFAYRQAEASGFVTFKNELTHWIYGVDKHSKFDDIMTMDALRDKLKDVT